jgi:hypothetical protein
MNKIIMYTRKLEDAGFNREQAEAQIGVIGDLMQNNFATKSDLQLLESNMKSEFASVRSEMKQLELRIINRMGVMISLAVGSIAALIKFFP